MQKENATELLSINGREVRITNPGKLYFSKQTKLSKLDLVRYYLSVAPGALAGIRDRPLVLKRYVNGAEGEAFYQKRAPAQHPSWLAFDGTKEATARRSARFCSAYLMAQGRCNTSACVRASRKLNVRNW